MAGDLVLITGATGHLGFRVLRYALEYGYQVRAAVRSEAKAKTVASNPALKAMGNDSQLSFVVVPDFLVPGAFDEAVKDVKYIVHVASPLVAKPPQDDDYEKYFIEPAVQGTLGVFESAKKAGTVERIVVTSSNIAIIPFMTMMVEGSEGVFTAEDRTPETKGPYPNVMAGYAASKVAALNRAEAWMNSEKRQFDVIHIHPSFIFGRDDLCESRAGFQTGTNGIPLSVAVGKASKGTAIPLTFNHVDDSARLHVQSLDPKIEGNQSFLVSNNGQDASWHDVWPIVEKHFPEEVKSGLFKNDGAYSDITVKMDVSKTEQTFGFKHANLEDVVVSVLGHFVELSKKEKGDVEN